MIKDIISKELLSAILGIEIFNLHIDNNMLSFNDSGTYTSCPSCGIEIKSSACSRTWNCKCGDSGDYEFKYPNYFTETKSYINIHELAHKCKEWAERNSFLLMSGKYYMNSEPIKDIYYCTINLNFILKDDGEFCTEGFSDEHEVEADTEPEAILKACQWILDQKCGNK